MAQGQPSRGPRVVLASSLLLGLLLAGCNAAPSSKGGAAASGPQASSQGALHSSFNYTAQPGGPAYSRDYSGVAKDDPMTLNGPPLALAYGPFQSCCEYAWIEASDLFVTDQMSAVRVRLDWTNTAQDQANLDIAVCIPWYCGFQQNGPDQTNLVGPQSESFDLVSGGHKQFLDSGQSFLVGARYSNLVTASGVPFTIHVDVVPVTDALAFADPYEVIVPPNATLGAQLVGPIRAEGKGDLGAGIMVYGKDDRPLAYHDLKGVNGSRHSLGHGPGSYVVFVFAYDGALARLYVDNATQPPKPARLLTETFGTVDVATLTDPAPHDGTFTFASPPGSMDTFPFFMYDSASGQVPGVTAGSSIQMSSSSGVVADVLIETVGAVTPVGQTCFTCNQNVDYHPENLIDDDGSYQVTYHSTGATGKFVLFTATYTR